MSDSFEKPPRDLRVGPGRSLPQSGDRPETDSSDTYHAFLLRIWRDEESAPWRIFVEIPVTGKRHGFTSLEKLYEFIERQIHTVAEHNSVVTSTTVE